MGYNEIRLTLEFKNMIVKIKNINIRRIVDIAKSKLMNCKTELRDFFRIPSYTEKGRKHEQNVI